MRNLLLLLVLANALYYMWSVYASAPAESGIAIVSEDDLGPPLQLAESMPSGNPGDAGAETASGRPSDLEAQVGRSCVSVGPFLENEEAEEVLADYQQAGLPGALRATEGEVFVGHWVQIREIENRTTANSMLAELKQDGLNEAYVVQTEDEGIKISLGLFSDLARAERVELQAEALDLPADITPRMREQNVVYVDLGLPPGRGAGSMIERFGEDRVLLRDDATCPGSD